MCIRDRGIDGIYGLYLNSLCIFVNKLVFLSRIVLYRRSRVIKVNKFKNPNNYFSCDNYLNLSRQRQDQKNKRWHHTNVLIIMKTVLFVVKGDKIGAVLRVKPQNPEPHLTAGEACWRSLPFQGSQVPSMLQYFCFLIT